MAAPHTLGDTMRNHDKAVYDWLNGLLVDYNETAGTTRNAFPVLRIMATPQQAFARVTDLLVHMGWLPGATAADMRATGDAKWDELPLPVITIERGEPTPAAELNSSATQKRVYLNPVTGQWEEHRWPAQYSTQYRMTAWSLKRSTDAYIREWVYGALGGKGKATHEALLTVTHEAPWGETLQRWRFEGSQDLSNLEGDNPRWIRTEFLFTLRTLVFFPPVGNSYLTHGVGYTGELITASYGDTTSAASQGGMNLDSPSAVPSLMSSNLFFYPVTKNLIPTEWPRTGDAEVSAGEVAPGGIPPGPNAVSLRAVLPDENASVELLERLSAKDTNGRTIVSVSLLYQSAGEPVDLEVAQRNGTTGVLTSAFDRSLPVVANRWDPVHVFTLVRGDTFQVNLVGTTAGEGEVTVADVDIRTVADHTRIAPQATSTPSVGQTRHEWGSLDNAPYLAILVLAAGNPAGPSVVSVQDDLSAPTYTASQTIDPDVNVGLVFLVQPKNGQLGLTVPTALALDTVYLQRYPGPYNGSTI